MSGTPISCVDRIDVGRPPVVSTDIQLVSEHSRRNLRSSSYRTLAVPRTRTTCALGDRRFAVLQDQACETVYKWQAMDNLANIWKRIYLRPRNRNALWLTFALYQYFTHLLTPLHWLLSYTILLPYKPRWPILKASFPVIYRDFQSQRSLIENF